MMRTWKLSITVMVVMLIMTWASVSFGAVSPEDAAKLGATLTGVGAEMAGNKDGTIPPYTGGLTKPPANYKPGSGVCPNPFPAEKPVFSINAQNMSQYADKLTEGTKAMMKKYPTYRIDVYKTHRTAALPDFVLKNTLKNSVKATTANGGLSVRGAHAGIPFPIPKDGYEAMWNHLMRYQGRALEYRMLNYNIDSFGKVILSASVLAFQEWPYYDDDLTRYDSETYWKAMWFYDNPPRKAGEGLILIDPVNMYEKGRVAYQYLPGQRRVKLAPEIGFDTPDGGTSGNGTYDEGYQFNGSMERYNMKLIGKKEFYVPYNTYKATFEAKVNEVFWKKYLNPDVVRWELHRMWIVEATLKPGKRHIYPKRRFYLDEDSWYALAGENYDARGFLYTCSFLYNLQSYNMPSPSAWFYSAHNLIADKYAVSAWPGPDGYVRMIEPRPERYWTPQTLAGMGVR